MNRYTILLNSEAETDLNKIEGYISGQLKNSDAAYNFIKAFFNSFERLEEFPLSCPICPTEKKYRMLIIDKYIAFYRIYEEEKTVMIHRILYGMSDYKRHI